VLTNDTSRPPTALLSTHGRLRREGFPIVSVLTGRRVGDARVYLTNWLATQQCGIVLAPEPSLEASCKAYQYRVGAKTLQALANGLRPPVNLPSLVFVGDLLQSLNVAAGLTSRYASLPVAVATTTDALLRLLLHHETPLPLVSKALQGLVPIEPSEDQILSTVVNARALAPLLRSPYEGLLYYMLETRDATRGRFKPNSRLVKPSGEGSYEVDLVANDAKLIIEIDGAQHGVGIQIKRDEAKQRDLEQLGYRVRRFSTDQVAADPVGVWQLISQHLHLPSSPT
jgi:very-short-patch-repair endonuclease